MPKKGFIDNVSVGNACTEDWNKMVGSRSVRMCEHCAKNVNNLSEMTRKDAKRLVRASDGNICIRYMKHPVTKRPVFADQMYQITRRAPGIAAGVMTASMSLSTMAYAQGGVSISRLPQVPIEEKIETSKAQPAEAPDEKVVRPNENESVKDAITDGSLEVLVVDPQGAVVSGATVTITNSDSTPQFSASAISNGEGFVAFEQMPVGTFQVDASANGFRLTRQAASVTLGKVTVLRTTLNIAGEIFLSGVIAVSRDYSTALVRAVDNDDIDEVRDLIARGENVNGKDENYDNITPLFVAVENGDREIVRLLLDSGAKVNVRDRNKQTPLMRIDDEASAELVEILVQAGAKLNLSDNEGSTALIYAAANASTDVLRALIDSGADVNIANKAGETPLMKAADKGDIESVRLLLISGANVNARDKEGDNAWDYADEDEIEELLVSFGVEVPPDEPETGLSDAPKFVISR